MKVASMRTLSCPQPEPTTAKTWSKVKLRDSRSDPRKKTMSIYLKRLTRKVRKELRELKSLGASNKRGSSSSYLPSHKWPQHRLNSLVINNLEPPVVKHHGMWQPPLSSLRTKVLTLTMLWWEVLTDSVPLKLLPRESQVIEEQAVQMPITMQTSVD